MSPYLGSQTGSDGTVRRPAPPPARATVEQFTVARRRPADAVRRVMDVAVASVALAVLSPLMAALGAIIRRDSPGPAIYRGARLGRGRRQFTVYKFRTMHAGVSDEAHRRYVIDLLRLGTAGPEAAGSGGDVRYKLSADPRVTRVGRWLRKSTLDELPQLLNVVRGEMSLVGPRPEVPYALEAYEPWHHERFTVKPGLTGLWQVSGRGELSPRDMLALDVEYVRRRSLWLDLRILARTVPAVLRGRGAS